MREGEVERVRRSTWALGEQWILGSSCSMPSIRAQSAKGFAPEEMEQAHEGRDVRTRALDVSLGN